MKRDRLALDFYERLIEKLTSERSTQTLEFEGVPRSRIVISNLLSVAEEEISIFWRSLKQPIWDGEEVYNAVIDAIGRGVGIKVVVQQDEGRTTDTREVLFDFNVPIIKHTSSELRDENFITCDGRAYALWKYSENKGVYSFNSPEVASKYRLRYGFKR